LKDRSGLIPEISGKYFLGVAKFTGKGEGNGKVECGRQKAEIEKVRG